jgi:hypothetical protein
MTRRNTAIVDRVVVGIVVAFALVGCSFGDRGAVGSGAFVEIPGVGSTRADVPRPTGAGSAPCDGDPLPAASDVPVATRVADLRKLGLFGDRGDTSDAALAAEISAGLADAWGSEAEVPKGLIDLAIAEQDHTRVWWRDLEADVVRGGDVYAQTIAEWSEISKGAFRPTDITETWMGESGPVTVTFRLDGSTKTLSPGYFEDWIDPGILAAIDGLIAESGRRFELYKAFDQTAFVMALSTDERRALEARGWCFE